MVTCSDTFDTPGEIASARRWSCRSGQQAGQVGRFLIRATRGAPGHQVLVKAEVPPGKQVGSVLLHGNPRGGVREDVPERGITDEAFKGVGQLGGRVRLYQEPRLP